MRRMDGEIRIPSREEIQQYRKDISLHMKRRWRRESKVKKTWARIQRFHFKYGSQYGL